MPGAFRIPEDIANRALQLLRRPAIYLFDDVSVEGRETSACYDQLRLAELRRSLWRFSTRRVILRAITTTTMRVVLPPWEVSRSYVPGDPVASGNASWVAIRSNNAQTPGDTPTDNPLYWDSYFGPVTVDVWSAQAYFTDELVYKTPGDGTYKVYRSLISNNLHDPEAVDSYDATVMYSTGQVVSYLGTNYQSLVALNIAHTPSTSPTQWTTTITSALVSNSWRRVLTEGTPVPAILRSLDIIYPLGVGPVSDSHTRNAYVLPAGFLRQAPTDPKAGLYPFLGAPTGAMADDWLFEGQFIVSRFSDPIMLRFVADVQSVTEFDSMFGEGLATRMAIELAPRLADGEHLASIIADAREAYARTISDARVVNGIEVGTVDPVEDDYILCRA